VLALLGNLTIIRTIIIYTSKRNRKVSAIANPEMNNPTLVPEPVVKGLDKDNSTRSIYSESLFSHGNEVLIQHSGNQYRLRRTRSGKLILTK
tara:strand:- start:1621 stop:1896 length:276 start_codon:yes stop_codon:yes gene_type:complete